MTTIKRLSSALFVTLFLLALSARAQTPSVSTVNITPDEKRVRVTAVGDVLDMSITVSDESGDVIFESGPVSGDHLDWAMSDPQGQRAPAGAYNLTVTYRTPSGKLKRRVEQVLVTEEVTGESKQEAAAPAPAAPVEGAGNPGKIAKFTAANTVGNSVMTESAGRIGVNTAAPTHMLTVFGGPKWTASGWVGSIALPNLGAIGWAANSAGQRRGIGHGNAGLIFFRTASNPGAATGAIIPDLTISNTGNVGVGTTAPASKLTVNGGIQILGSGNGIKFADGSIQTKAIAGTINGTGTANRLAKFTGPNSFGNSSVAEVSGNVGIGTVSPNAKLDVIGSISASSVSTSSVSTSSLTANSFQVSGNVGQSSFAYGLPKAMLRMQGDGTQVNCYNGATRVSSTSFASCGFSVTPVGGGVYDINFGSAVSNTQYQFVSLSGSSSIILTAFPATTSIRVAVGNASFGYAYYVLVF